MSRSAYAPEIYEFVKENVEECSNKTLAAMVNERFGTSFTESSMKSYVGNHKLFRKTKKLRDVRYSDVFPEEIVKYIHENYIGCGPTEMTQRLKELFETHYTVSQIRGYYRNHGIKSGLTGRFEKGCVSRNKGQKIPEHVYAKIRGTMFQKGHTPHNQKDVGEYSHTTEGYLIRKVKEEGSQRERWEFIHRAVWEEHHGAIPAGMMVIFLDGNKDNCDISNLALVSLKENMQLTGYKMRFEDGDLTKAGLGVIRLKNAINDKTKGKDNDAKRNH